MDIIDILMARALNPNVQIDVAAATARKAVADATSAVDAAEQALEDAQAAVEAAQSVTDIVVIQPEEPELTSVTKLWVDSDSDQLIQVPLMEDVVDEIGKLSLATDTQTSTGAVTRTVKLKYGDTVQSTATTTKYYTSTGQNSDGTMTQKAITNAINSHGGGSGGSTNLGRENAGKIVIVGDDGNIQAGTLKESQIKYDADTPTADNVLGISIDYENRSFARIGDAVGLNAGADFDRYTMYGGRKRCNVADDGTINAFYGETLYKDDGSNGQVMVYQPKFYYKREITAARTNTVGQIVEKENLYISESEQTGFKIHPLFKNAAGEEIEFALIPAYEGSAYFTRASAYDLIDSDSVDYTTDMLSSIAGAKPISGANKTFTIANAEQLATNRGTGWHITNMRVESVLQMLFMVEYGMMNCQAAFELGPCQLMNKSQTNCSLITGSTAVLGDATGHATESVQTIDNTTRTGDEAGVRAISYRGMENPWGDMWRMVGGVNISGDGHQSGGIPYICNDYTYTPTLNGENYGSANFSLSNTDSWIGNMGYGGEAYDWVYMPAKVGTPASSALPVGDYYWAATNVNGINICKVGGLWYWEQQDGLFNYASDNKPADNSHSKNARLMFVPTKNSTYRANVNKWKNKMGV